MAEKLSRYLLKGILEDEIFKTKFENLMINYSEFLFGKRDFRFDEESRLLLKYADLLSLSDNQIHQNTAQQIVILLSQIFADNLDIKIVKESVYRNVSNFASIDFLEKKNSLADVKYDFLRQAKFLAHRDANTAIGSNKALFDTQKEVLDELNENQYYSFSAPTSMGKTFVIMNFIKEKLSKQDIGNFVIIVPTRALLSEIANKLIYDLKDYLGENCHKVITNLSAVKGNEKFIAVLTPERLYYSLLKLNDIDIQYLFIDEAHKISDSDKRSVVYYKILEMLREKENVHIYFSSPVIPNPDVYLELTNFYSQNKNSNGQAFLFSPVVQNKIYLDFQTNTYSIVNNVNKEVIKVGDFSSYFTEKMQALMFLGNEKCNLIYVSSANKAIDYAVQLSKMLANLSYSTEIQKKIDHVARLIEQKIHKEYFLADLIRKGVAFHIGALPAEIRIEIESLLREGYIRYCFCTSTLLEGVNVPADNLFIFSNKKGNAKMSEIDAFNLIGRAGRVSLNEYGNVFVVIEDVGTKNYFDSVLINPLPNQNLIPQKAIDKKHKILIVETLLQGKTNLLERGEKYKDKGLTEKTYEYATKCLNMLLHDICLQKDSYIVRDFRKNGVLTPQNIIDIRKLFGALVNKDDDINVSARQKESLYNAIVTTGINYPNTFSHPICHDFLKKLSQIFQWPIYEMETLGKGDKISYYTVILTQWMKGDGLHEIIRGAIDHYATRGGRLVSFTPNFHFEPYNGSLDHKNRIINEVMKDIENIINYKFSTYFMRFSEAIIKLKGPNSLTNDWYEYVEYGTNNETVIALQKYGFMREQALVLLKHPYLQYIQWNGSSLELDKKIKEKATGDLLKTIETVEINYPEIFI